MAELHPFPGIRAGLLGVLLLSAWGLTTRGQARAGEGSDVSVSVNGLRNALAVRGWPVIVEGVYSPGNTGVVVARLKVTDPSGQPVTVAFERLAESPPDAEGFVTVYWALDPDKSTAAGTGPVEVMVELVRRQEVVAASAAATMEWRAPPAELADADYDRHMGLLVRYDLIRDKSDEAAAKVAQWRAKRPANAMSIATSGDLHFAAGRLREAARDYQDALKQCAKDNPRSEPPAELLARQRAVAAAMARAGTKRATVAPDARGGK